MCILQRYAFILIGLFAFVSALTRRQRLISTIMSILIFIFSAVGLGVSGRHVWLEHNPPKIFDCGADLGFMVDTFPLAEALPMIFRGAGDCSVVLWRFLSFSIAEWALALFLLILLTEVWVVKTLIRKQAV
jgi:disulfide bond formation protein DsbB